MATQIVIANNNRVIVDDSYVIKWADKGTNWVDGWCPNNYHYVIWNNLTGPNEIQTKDPVTGNMTGNIDLNATSDAVGSTTIADLLTWAETRKGQIDSAKLDYDNYCENAKTSWTDAGNDASDFHAGNSATSSFIDWSRTSTYYDSNY